MQLDAKKRYWRSLLYDPPTDPRLIPGHAEELRAALRDALHELEDRDKASCGGPFDDDLERVDRQVSWVDWRKTIIGEKQ